MMRGLSSLSPRIRLGLALGLVLGLTAWAQLQGASVVAWARALLGGVSLAALGGWLMYRERVGGPRFADAEPLRVVSRRGLSPRCGLALVEVEGSRYFVVFGESFAEIRPAHPPTRVRSRLRRRMEPTARGPERLS